MKKVLDFYLSLWYNTDISMKGGKVAIIMWENLYKHYTIPQRLEVTSEEIDYDCDYFHIDDNWKVEDYELE